LERRGSGGLWSSREFENATSHGCVWSYLRFTQFPELYDRVDVLDLHQQQTLPPALDTDTTANSSATTANNTPTPTRPDVFADFV